MSFGKRQYERVDFAKGLNVHIVGMDGTWRRACVMIDISQTGARLMVEGSLQGLNLKEFFLLLTSTGLVYRRCRMVRLSGDQIGIEFIRGDKPVSKRFAVKPALGEPAR